jgi:putative transposase
VVVEPSIAQGARCPPAGERTGQQSCPDGTLWWPLPIKEHPPFVSGLLISLKRQIHRCSRRMHQCLLQWTKPTNRSLLSGTRTDLTCTRAELSAENALYVSTSSSSVERLKRSTCTRTERIRLVLLVRAVRHWKQALFIVQTDTLLGWHRQAFRWYWRQRSKPASTKPKIAAETVALIQAMARDNRLWGAEHIRGELLKLGIHVSKRTIQKYMRRGRTRPSSQTWSNFLYNHSHAGHWPATSCRSRISSSARSLPSASSS